MKNIDDLTSIESILLSTRGHPILLSTRGHARTHWEMTEISEVFNFGGKFGKVNGKVKLPIGKSKRTISYVHAESKNVKKT